MCILYSSLHFLLIDIICRDCMLSFKLDVCVYVIFIFLFQVSHCCRCHRHQFFAHGLLNSFSPNMFSIIFSMLNFWSDSGSVHKLHISCLCLVMANQTPIYFRSGPFVFNLQSSGLKSCSELTVDTALCSTMTCKITC